MVSEIKGEVVETALVSLTIGEATDISMKAQVSSLPRKCPRTKTLKRDLYILQT
jgi:hypothetical protein